MDWLLEHPDVDIETLDAGTHGQSGLVAKRARDGILSATGGSRNRKALDKHRLDIALSLGRHAVERAKLAGCDLLVGWGRETRCDRAETAGANVLRPQAPDRCPAEPDWDVRASGDPYEALRLMGSPELAAFVGILIAGAQIGLPVLLPGADASIAARVASSLHPHLGEWLTVTGWTPRALPANGLSLAYFAQGAAFQSLTVETRTVVVLREASV
ncbi:nicotinate-nucleotide--dimethylbenzimidazole phosphoribosyltransferase [Thiocystis violascens]|nr:nicotinate-nucleotide--dimethylbenzimidazole phosphoribosyltransferase [Thiocystis violascens]